MRAVFLGEDFDSKSNVLTGDKANHLINVLRIKSGAEVLGLDGLGGVFKLVIEQVSRREVHFMVLDKLEYSKGHEIDFAIGKVKKDAMDLSLKQCCELGVSSVFILNSEYSQRYSLKPERVEKLLISGIEQANNPFLPLVEELEFSELASKIAKVKDYENIVYFSSNPNIQQARTELSTGRTLIIVGPEGGFSTEEELVIGKMDGVCIINLTTKIMRTPTAISCSLGYFLGATSQK